MKDSWLGFDAVIVLSVSNWKTEARSNRYHFVSRFARRTRTIFVSPAELKKSVRKHEVEFVGVLEVWWTSDLTTHRGATRLTESIKREGFSNPLFWVYSLETYHKTLLSFPGCTIILHATEDVITPLPWKKTFQSYLHLLRSIVADPRKIRGRINRLWVMRQQSFNKNPKFPYLTAVITVSRALRLRLLEAEIFDAPVFALCNGVDFSFYFKPFRPDSLRLTRTAVYQGGVNLRLDFKLLEELAQSAPDWNFVIAGAQTRPHLCRKLARLSNVTFTGFLPLGELRQLLQTSTCGLIPFIDHPALRSSLPLKAFEYVAAGLPVVTVPIDDLSRFPELFLQANGSKGFAEGLTKAEQLLSDPRAAQRREEVARNYDYEESFKNLEQILARLRAGRIDFSEMEFPKYS